MGTTDDLILLSKWLSCWSQG